MGFLLYFGLIKQNIAKYVREIHSILVISSWLLRNVVVFVKQRYAESLYYVQIMQIIFDIFTIANKHYIFLSAKFFMSIVYSPFLTW